MLVAGPNTNPFKLFARLMQDLDGSVDEWRFSYTQNGKYRSSSSYSIFVEHINTAQCMELPT